MGEVYALLQTKDTDRESSGYNFADTVAHSSIIKSCLNKQFIKCINSQNFMDFLVSFSTMF